MDDLIAKIRARRDRLAAELKRVEKLLADHERVAEEINDFVSELPDEFIAYGEIQDGHKAAPAPAEASSVDDQRRLRGPKGSSPVDIAIEAERIIQNEGRPMTRFELIAPIEEAGLSIGGYDKPRNLGTILWRSGNFVNTGDGYWPKDVERPSAASNAPASASLDFHDDKGPEFATIA